MSVAIVAPAGVRSIAMMRACLVLGRAADRNDAGAVRLRDAALAIFRAVERVVAFGLVLGLVMGSSEVHAISRTTSAPPRQITRQGRTLKRALAAPSHHSNAPIKPERQSILSNIVALTPAHQPFHERVVSALVCPISAQDSKVSVDMMGIVSMSCAH